MPIDSTDTDAGGRDNNGRTSEESLDIIASSVPNLLHILGRILEELKDLTAAVEALNQPKTGIVDL
jgi:hypothetical protein